MAQTAQAQADQLNQQLAQAQTQEQQTKEQLQQALSLALAMQSQGIEQAQQLQQMQQSNHHHWLQTQALQAQITALQNSWSWTLTAPLRLGASLLVTPITTARTLVNKTLGWVLNTFQTPLGKAMAWVLAQKGFSETINRWLKRRPHLHAHLVAIARQQGIIRTPVSNETISAESPGADSAEFPETQASANQQAQLTPRTRQIYQDLKVAIEKQNGQD